MERTRNEGNSTHQQQQDQQQPPPPPARHHHPPPARHHHPPPPNLKCPRCDSSNTKFCYYNNYSLSQPRYFCKACRRYWTHGGTLRNVPVGGSCRKNKRPSKTSSASNLSSPTIRSQNPTAVISGQPPRPLPPVIPPMGNSFYGGSGGFLPSFAAMQSLPACGGSQGAAAAEVNLGGGGGGQFGANMSLLQAMTLQSLKYHAANQFQPPANLFPAQQNLINPPIRPWTQTGGSSSSVVGSSFWNCATGGGGDQAGSSFSAPNQWSTDNLPGFNPQLANFSFIFWTCLKHLTVSSMVEVATDHQQSIPHFVFQTQ